MKMKPIGVVLLAGLVGLVAAGTIWGALLGLIVGLSIIPQNRRVRTTKRIVILLFAVLFGLMALRPIFAALLVLTVGLLVITPYGRIRSMLVRNFGRARQPRPM